MSDPSHHNFLLTSQLRSLRCEQLRHAERIGHLGGRLESIERFLHQHLLPHPTRPGPPSSTAPDSNPPTHGTPASSPSATLMKQVKVLGDWARLLSVAVGIVKGAIWLWGVLIPSLLLAATALWKLLAPHLSRLVPGF